MTLSAVLECDCTVRISREEIDACELYATLLSADSTHSRGAIASFCGVVRHDGLLSHEGFTKNSSQYYSANKLGNGKEYTPDGSIVFESLTGSDEDFISTTKALILDTISALPSPSLSITVVHRKGVVRPGHLTSAVFICAQHQEDALAALCLVSRTLKEKMPIWKHSLAASAQKSGD